MNRTIDFRRSISNLHAISEDNAELLILWVSVFLIYSFNYHFLWLSYDFVTIAGAVMFFKNHTEPRNRYIIIILIPVLIYALLRVLIDGHIFKGLLSVWDTMKHVFMLYLLFYVYQKNEKPEPGLLLKSNNNISKLLLVTLFVEFIVTAYQFQMKIPWDNVAGTFGDGACHSLGYLSVAVFAIVIFAEINWSSILIVTILAVSINIFAENIGFFIFLALIAAGRLLFVQRISLKPLLLYLSLFTLIGAILYIIPYGFIIHKSDNESIANVVISRSLNAFSVPSEPVSLSSNPHNRSQFTNLAWHYGGLFGYGIGAFSNIYRMQGYDSGIMHGLEINISELTHLVAEWGLIGAILVAGFYCLLFSSYFISWKGKILACVLFVSAFTYSSVLMTEPQILFLGIALAVISNYERNLKRQDIG